MDAWQRRCTYAYASRIHAFRSSTYIGIPPLRARRPGVIGGCRDECSGEAGGNTRHTLMVAAKEQRLLVNGEVAAGRKERDFVVTRCEQELNVRDTPAIVADPVEHSVWGKGSQ